MKPIWTIDGEDVSRLQGDSAGFVRFLNALLSQQAHAGHLSDASLHLNQKDTEGDGGVDAVVDSAIPPEHDPTGYFAVPTCWQFKASPTENIRAKVSKGEDGGQEVALQQEINKPHARRLIEQGYGYRFCIADDMPDQKKSHWAGWLLAAARQINPQASPPMVLTASDLAVWANRFPALISEFFRPSLSQCRSLRTWQNEITGLTPEFVSIGAWEAAVRAIQVHVDFSRRVTTVLTVQGEAGVGKTRCTYEALARHAAHHALLVYTSDERFALELARQIARDLRAKAILVADECSLETRDRLRQVLPGCADRFRVIAIDNSLQRAGGAGEVRLVRITLPEVDLVLGRNYPALPPDRRRSYASLAEGFIRLAVDLCENDYLIPPDGRVDSVFKFFHDLYLQRRLQPDELDAILLIALLPRVGYRDDVADELVRLCEHPMIGLRPSGVVQIAQRLRQAPGFIAFGGRFLYVTPTLIAQVAFQSAWERWVDSDPPGFLRALPESLIEPFIARTQSAGSPAMGQAVADFFLDWARGVGPPDLGREDAVLRLVRLAEAQPETVLPLVSGLFEGCSPDELRQVHSGSEGERARRELVWLAEKLTYFPEYFRQAERMLLRLALAETEPHLGNNASRVWAALFRITLSGSPVPFPERLLLLEERLRTSDSNQLILALTAVDEVLFDAPVFRLATPPILFGRLPPPEWAPADDERWCDCRGAALEMLARLTVAGGPLAEGVRRAVVKRLSTLLLAGYYNKARAVIGEERLPDSLLTEVIHELEEFLDVFCKDHRIPVHRPDRAVGTSENGSGPPEAEVLTFSGVVEPDLERQVREWCRSLVPQDLHGRLVSLIGQDPWHQQFQGDHDAWQQEVDRLGTELIASPSALSRELVWLCSPEARSAFHLGQALGSRDHEGALLERMFGDVPGAGGTPLARGYLEGMKRQQPQLLARANEQLDRLEANSPRLAYEVLWGAGDQVQQFQRLLRMVDAGMIPLECLRSLEHGVGDRPLTGDELRQALSRLRNAAEDRNAGAAQAAVHLLHSYLHRDRRTTAAERLRADERMLGDLEVFLRLALEAGGREPSLWMRLLEDLSEIAGESAVRLAVRALASADYNARTLAQRQLVRLAGTLPEAVLQELGKAFSRPAARRYDFLIDLSPLLRTLPVSVVRDWVGSLGVAEARVLARHLEPPHLDDRKQPVVPELTAFVLERFADDEEVFRNFCAGSHSGRAYTGDIASQYMQEAEVARQFLEHPLPRVRQWAADAMEQATQQAAYWRQRDEEMVRV